MAFVRRTWLARIGIGLNKFLIGEKDGAGRQTLVNDPDSVTQEGDVISADNLNDLEGRIENEFTKVHSEISGMKLEELWSASPSFPYAGGTIPLNTTRREFLIEYTNVGNSYASEIVHVYFQPSDSVKNSINLSLSRVSESSGVGTIVVETREISYSVTNQALTIGECKAVQCQNGTTQYTTNNYDLVPIAIYAVGVGMYS